MRNALIGRTLRLLSVLAIMAAVVAVGAPRAEAAFSVSVTPNTGIVDGQAVTVIATDPPDTFVFVNVCDDAVLTEPSFHTMMDSCEASDDTYRSDAPMSKVVRQSFTSWSGRQIDCGITPDDCVIAVGTTPQEPGAMAFAPISVTRTGPAPAVITVEPDADLVDGQTITVTGERIPSSYDGPVLFLPTGGWGLSLCPNVVRFDPTLVDVLTRCAVLAPGAVDVPGSTISVTTEAPARPTTTVGGSTLDCTNTNCFVALTRWESNATVSVIYAPVTFARP